MGLDILMSIDGLNVILRQMFIVLIIIPGTTPLLLPAHLLLCLSNTPLSILV